MQGSPPDMQAFTDFFKGFSKCHKVVIDCTANAQVPSYYATWLSSGIHVITPNKKLCSGPLNDWTKVMEAAKENGTHFMYEVRPAAVQCTVLHWLAQHCTVLNCTAFRVKSNLLFCNYPIPPANHAPLPFHAVSASLQ